MIVLASQSPRRAELLHQIGVAFRTHPTDIDESVLPGESPEGYVERMATAKARAALGDALQPVLGADTAVVLERRIFGKPLDRDDAIDMLLTLSGRTHQVLTGVAVVADTLHFRLSVSRVLLRTITRAEAVAYWASGEPADKAGGYAIQGLGAMFVEHIEGSYSGIMGLPLFETAQILERIGIPSAVGVYTG